MLLFLLESKVLILKILFFCVIDIIIFIIITSQHIRGAWAPASVLGTACAYVALGLLP
jgi:hypothetical protein